MTTPSSPLMPSPIPTPTPKPSPPLLPRHVHFNPTPRIFTIPAVASTRSFAETKEAKRRERVAGGANKASASSSDLLETAGTLVGSGAHTVSTTDLGSRESGTPKSDAPKLAAPVESAAQEKETASLSQTRSQQEVRHEEHNERKEHKHREHHGKHEKGLHHEKEQQHKKHEKNQRRPSRQQKREQEALLAVAALRISTLSIIENAGRDISIRPQTTNAGAEASAEAVSCPYRALRCQHPVPRPADTTPPFCSACVNLRHAEAAHQAAKARHVAAREASDRAFFARRAEARSLWQGVSDDERKELIDAKWEEQEKRELKVVAKLFKFARWRLSEVRRWKCVVANLDIALEDGEEIGQESKDADAKRQTRLHPSSALQATNHSNPSWPSSSSSSSSSFSSIDEALEEEALRRDADLSPYFTPHPESYLPSPAQPRTKAASPTSKSKTTATATPSLAALPTIILTPPPPDRPVHPQLYAPPQITVLFGAGARLSLERGFLFAGRVAESGVGGDGVGGVEESGVATILRGPDGESLFVLRASGKLGRVVSARGVDGGGSGGAKWRLERVRI